jgi:hypothetical protein
VKAYLARALVRWASNWIEAAYSASMRGMPRWEAWWAAGARRVQRFAFPIALRLDHEAAVDQMIEECWWG